MAAKKVLIVEDDSIVAQALAGVVKKAGYGAVVCQRPDDAIEALDKDSFKLVFIDCLLPQTPGLDLAKTIRKNFNAKILPIVMMSGIFTDKQMMKEMIQEVNAIDFLKKPFELNEVLKFLDKETATVSDGSLAKSTFSLPDRIGANPTKVSELLGEVSRLHGFEIPLLLCTAVNNAYTGVISFLSENNEKSAVSFNHGSIVSVECADIQSFLGKLLVSGNWVLAEDLERTLQNLGMRKIGEELATQNYISPHAVYEVMEQQMALRLSKLIQDQNYVVTFENIGIEADDPSIDPDNFYLILSEMIASRITNEWLDQQLFAWQDYSLRMGPSHDRNRKEYNVPLISGIKEIVTSLESAGVFSGAQQVFRERSGDFNRAFYYLLCMRFVLFAEKVPQMSPAERIARLDKIWTQMKDLNLMEVFQLMGGRKDMDAREVREVFAEFLQRHLGSAPPTGADSNQIVTFESVRARINQAYELFLDPHRLAQYEREIETGKITQRTEALAKVDEAKKFLSMKQYSNAMVSIKKATDLYSSLDNINLFTAWARIGLLANGKTRAKEIAEIDQLMARVPHEEKISAIGSFVLGLFSKAKGEIAGARKYFETALVIDKNLIEARRELNTLGPIQTPKKPDLLHGDLGQVLGSIFKKS